MAETISILVGSWENFDKVLKTKLNAAWTAANTGGVTPSIHDATSENKESVWPKNKAIPAIYLNPGDDDQTDESHGHRSRERKEMVQVDIFGKNHTQTRLFTKEFTRILNTNQIPQHGYWDKSDGDDSAAAHVEQTAWQRAPNVEKLASSYSHRTCFVIFTYYLNYD